MTKFTRDEKKLIDYSKKKILEYSKYRKENGLYDIIHAFVLSESGKIYDGTCFESNLPQTCICAETHAVSNMLQAETEKAKIKSLLVADPVPKSSRNTIMPCGRCRHVINEFGTRSTTVLSSDYIRHEKKWDVFTVINKYKITELYPKPYVPTKWE